MLTGVFAEYLGPLYAAALKELGVRRAWVVFGCEGLDELSIAGPSKVWSLKDDTVEEFTVTPEDAGLSRHPLESCGSGKPDENAGVLRKLIAGELQGPVVDFVLLNAGAALHVAGKADSLREGVEVARTAMMEGKGASVLEKYASASKLAA
jgi:anthranilate phosphoribosyltransferase